MGTNNLYPSTSPYNLTNIYTENKINYLDIMDYRPIPRIASDVLYTVPFVYQYRPDLLAYDMYGDAKLWWVFAARNPNRLKDPLFDFTTGTGIYIPKAEVLKQLLGY